MTSSGNISAAVAASVVSGGVESVGFLNDLVAQLWDYINVAAGKLTKEIVEPMFAEMLPGPLKSLHFEKIDLGKKPILFDNVDVLSRDKGVVKLNIDVHWDGECDIELAAGALKFGVEAVKIKGRMSVLLCPLIERMPVVSAMQVGFINPPDLELDFTGLAQVADFSFVDDTIRSIIRKIIASLLVLPNRLLIKLDPANDFFMTYKQPLGMVRFTVQKGQGFKVPKQFIKDIPDVYCKVEFGANEIWKTTTKNNDTTPEWDESKDYLLSDHDQVLKITAFDDDIAGDDNLGSGSITVGDLLLKGKVADVPLKQKGEDSGATITIKSTIYEFTDDTISFEIPENRGKNHLCGLATVMVPGAFDIPGAKEDAASKVKLNFGSSEFFSPIIFNNPGVDALNPPFDWAVRLPLTHKTVNEEPDFELTLMNGKCVLGSIKIPFSEVVGAERKTVTRRQEMDEGSSVSFRINICGVHVINN
ncbi:Synaptotagmin [Gracilaria domingensis]|nr:Synaptotagmin [Gracilaria domingensis]